MRRCWACALLTFCCATLAARLCAQQSDGKVLYRPKIAEFSVESLYDYKTASTSESFGSATHEVDHDRLYKIKLGLPIVMKQDRLFALQLKYYQLGFNFDADDAPIDYDLYQHLDARQLSSTGLRFIYQRDLAPNKKLTFAGGAEVNSDAFTWHQHTTKYFLSGIYEKKLNRNTTLGGGLVVNMDMGRLRVYPVIQYVKDLSPKWTLDLQLPKSVAIRRNINPANFLIAKVQVRGWRYNLTNAVEGGQRDLTLRRADIQFSLSWEHEIHDWLWVGADVGYNKNFRYFLANPGDRARDALIDLTSRDAKYLKLSVFLVPPKKFYR